jgi:hypothetical protein
MLAGTGFHDQFAQAVSTQEVVEQFVEFEGVAFDAALASGNPSGLPRCERNGAGG